MQLPLPCVSPEGVSRRQFLGTSLGILSATALGGLARPVQAASPILLPALPWAATARIEG